MTTIARIAQTPAESFGVTVAEGACAAACSSAPAYSPLPQARDVSGDDEQRHDGEQPERDVSERTDPAACAARRHDRRCIGRPADRPGPAREEGRLVEDADAPHVAPAGVDLRPVDERPLLEEE